MVATPEAKINQFVVYGFGGRRSVSVIVIPQKVKGSGRGNEPETDRHNVYTR